ncbi:DUF1848 domain-containing protein [Desulfatirhabdium butyrativorans]|uniref:DUF1848 domain-containing protein n=1 Tax=Desulfatirhabdium butyrativorans TaxID=340467 RepID=UPI0004181146|nr:DUF1848 domain-containing protein [Desulfatirhabdium butyrativorans]
MKTGQSLSAPATILSASRRTDIPAFYMDWFMDRIGMGFFERVHPYNQKVARIPCNPQDVHSIVFWSKNFGPFIEGGFDRRLSDAGYRMFFQFTLNPEHSLLEPNVPPLRQRIDQMAYLIRTFGAKSVVWRFDPVCIGIGPQGQPFCTSDRFAEMAAGMAGIGVQTCTFSFLDMYAKVARRSAAKGVTFLDPGISEKIGIASRMAAIATQAGIRLQTCCEADLLERLSGDVPITAASCIPAPLLIELYGEGCPVLPDKGQRRSQGCGCYLSKDIGSYKDHPCYHDCLFCYAHPMTPKPDSI